MNDKISGEGLFHVMFPVTVMRWSCHAGNYVKLFSDILNCSVAFPASVDLSVDMT